MTAREQMIAKVRQEMPERRWQHTLGVMEESVRLAERFGADPFKAETAAILHDAAKYWPIAKQVEIVRREKLGEDLAAYDKALLHAPIGAWLAEHEYGVSDPAILDAIRWHTSGRERMSLLDKVVCLADYIEPGRDFPGVDRLRQTAQTDLEQALVYGFDSTIRYLCEIGKLIYPTTIAARNGLIFEIMQRKPSS